MNDCCWINRNVDGYIMIDVQQGYFSFVNINKIKFSYNKFKFKNNGVVRHFRLIVFCAEPEQDEDITEEREKMTTSF